MPVTALNRAAARELLRRRAGRADDYDTGWFDNPNRFLADVMPSVELTGYQAEMFDALPVYKRVSARGPRGLGKTMWSSLAVIWFAVTRERAGIDWKVLTTAGSWSQLTTYLWPEIHKWQRRVEWDTVGMRPWRTDNELLKTAVQLDLGAATAASPSNHELIEGLHGSQVMVLFDESKVIDPAVFDSIEGATLNSGDGGGEDFFLVAVSTPGPPIGRFYDIHARRPGFDDWWIRHVTKDETIAAGRMNPERADKLREAHGETGAYYMQSVLGEFAADATDALIPLSHVEAAMVRWEEHEAAGLHDVRPDRCGVDVARHGEDRTVVTACHGNHVLSIFREAHTDNIVDLADRVGAQLGVGVHAVVDADGLGAGTADRFRQLGRPATVFHGAQRVPFWRDHTGELEAENRRVAAWHTLREKLDPAVTAEDDLVCLPRDDELVGDLTGVRRAASASGRLNIEKKAQTKARLRRSPDTADSVVYSQWVEVGDPNPPEPAGVESVPEPGERWSRRLR